MHGWYYGGTAPDQTRGVERSWRLFRRRTIGGEEVHGVPVEVAGGAVVVLGGSGVGVAGEDLRVAKRHAGIQRVGERGVP